MKKIKNVQLVGWSFDSEEVKSNIDIVEKSVKGNKKCLRVVELMVVQIVVVKVKK